MWAMALSGLKAEVDKRNKFKKFQAHYSVVCDQVLVWVLNPKNKFRKR